MQSSHLHKHIFVQQTVASRMFELIYCKLYIFGTLATMMGIKKIIKDEKVQEAGELLT